MKKPAKVFIVDDEKDFADNVALLLAEEGFHATACASGAELLAKLENETPDLIILDIMMPSMTGLHALAEIRKNPKHGKLRVMLSSASREPAAEKIWQDFLPKPFDIDELIARVKKHCA